VICAAISTKKTAKSFLLSYLIASTAYFSGSYLCLKYSAQVKAACDV
jgi:hypothetical protein